MLRRRFFMMGPAPLVIAKLFPKREPEDKDDEPRPPGPEDKMSDAPEFRPRGSNEEVPDVVDILRRDNTDLLIANTTAETALFTFPVPAYMLDGDRGLRVTIKGARKNTTGGAVDTIFRIKYGATTLWQHNQSVGDDAATCPFLLEFEICAKNSDAIQEMDGRLSIFNVNSPTIGEGSAITGLAVDCVLHGESAEDATTALDLVFSVEMDVANANAWWLHRKSLVELL